MKWKHILLVGLAVVMVMSVGMAAAQNGNGGGNGGGRQRPGGPGMEVVRTAIEAAAAETGLNAADIVEAVQGGSTLAEVITANGGSVETVIEQTTAAATEAINNAVAEGLIPQERADRLLANLPDVIARAFDGELMPNRGERANRRSERAGERALLNAIVDETGLNLRELFQQARSGATLEEVITAAGGDASAVVEAAVALATEDINAAVEAGRLTAEQGEELIAGLEPLFNDLMSGDLFARATQARVGIGVLRLAGEQTGLSAQEIADQLQSGVSLGDILSANGVEPAAFADAAIAQADARLDELVANGRLNQERADGLLSAFSTRLQEHLGLAAGI